MDPTFELKISTLLLNIQLVNRIIKLFFLCAYAPIIDMP